jgi:hypothetical protein
MPEIESLLVNDANCSIPAPLLQLNTIILLNIQVFYRRCSPPACKRTAMISVLAVVNHALQTGVLPQVSADIHQQATARWPVLLCVKMDRWIQSSVQAISLETKKLDLYSTVSWGEVSYTDDLAISYQPVWLVLGMLNASLNSCITTQKVYHFLSSSSVLWCILRALVLD